MAPHTDRHPLLAELAEHVGRPRLVELVQAFEEARDEVPGTAIYNSIARLFESLVEGGGREDRQG